MCKRKTKQSGSNLHTCALLWICANILLGDRIYININLTKYKIRNMCYLWYLIWMLIRLYLYNFMCGSSDYNLYLIVFVSQEETSSITRAKPSSCAVNWMLRVQTAVPWRPGTWTFSKLPQAPSTVVYLVYCQREKSNLHTLLWILYSYVWWGLVWYTYYQESKLL